MELHQLKPNFKRKKKKRVGRGGKRGTYSGRGIKGQKARAGHRIKPQEREIIQKIPKLRGVKNKPLRPKPVVLNIGELLEKIDDEVIDRELLLSKGLIKKSDKRVKILGEGEVKRKVYIKGLEISKKVKEKIEKAGGKVI